MTIRISVVVPDPNNVKRQLNGDAALRAEPRLREFTCFVTFGVNKRNPSVNIETRAMVNVWNQVKRSI